MTGEQVLLGTPYIKWLLEHGLVITKVYSVIKAEGRKVYGKFVDYVSDSRRKGDGDESMATLAETAKILGNGAAGHTIMNKRKHTSTAFLSSADRNKVAKKVNSHLFRDLDEIGSGDDLVYELDMGKKKIKLDNPIHVGSMVYQWAKVRMLAFYYDVMDKYFDRSDWQYTDMDTDSAYMAISAPSFDQMKIKEGMEEEYGKEKYDWFMDYRTPESKKYTRRIPGLFKVEYTGTGIVALASKLYFVTGTEEEKDKYKLSSKGVQKANNADLLTFEKYKDCLDSGEARSVTNRGFRMIDDKMITYSQTKRGLTPIYDKRIVLEDGRTTIPSPL
eukprot:Lithocolla_globosa_v1_NODE_3122_length_1759_cov_57.233568.p1 type:complete len:331 gc:universal NODE_3122_length_1759_cov_57.233568:631-1623(+)